MWNETLALEEILRKAEAILDDCILEFKGKIAVHSNKRHLACARVIVVASETHLMQIIQDAVEDDGVAKDIQIRMERHELWENDLEKLRAIFKNNFKKEAIVSVRIFRLDKPSKKPHHSAGHVPIHRSTSVTFDDHRFLRAMKIGWGEEPKEEKESKP